MNRCVKLMAWHMLFLPLLALAQGAPVLVLKSRIPLLHVQGRMDHLGVDVQGQRLFATANDNHTLEVVDLKAGRQAHTLAELDKPQGAYFDGATNHLFIATEGDGGVRIFDGTSYQLLKTVTLASDADNIRYDSRTHRVLVGYGGEKFLKGKVLRGHGDGALALLDTAGTKTGDISIDAHPESFQLERSGTRVFVNVPDRHEVQVADLLTGRVLAHWAIANCTDNFPMALDEPHHRLFIGCRSPATLQVLDTGSGTRVATLEAAASDDIFYDADRGRLYVLGDEGSVVVFQRKDADHYDRIASFPSGPGAWTGLWVPEWAKLFVSAPAQGEQAAQILIFEAN
jgi:DNA-binding beta-propeller fold protein YncE